MSTAEKLTYLNDTKQLLKENINSLGGNLTNEPFRQYASVLEGIYESLPKVSGIGTSLSLSPTMVGKIKLNEIQGDTQQDGTPTPDTPVPIQNVTGLQNVTISNADNTDSNTYEVNLGKNLLDTSNLSDTTNLGVSVSFNNSEITLDGTLTSDGNILPWQNSIITKLKAGTYTFHFETLNGSFSNPNNKDITFTFYNATGTSLGNVNLRGTRPSITFTLNEEQNVRFGIYANGVLTLNNWKIGFQLEKGTQATSYSPYFTPIELNKIGTYQDSIKKSNGKNLFDKDTITSGYRLDPSGEPYPDTNCFLSEYIPVEPNTIYTRNVTASAYECIGFYTSDKTFISRNTSDSTTTTPSNSYYVRITGYNTNLNTMQLEKGNQATTYEPYGKVWYVHKEIGKVVLDGSTGSYSNVSTNRFNIDNLITDFKKSEEYNLSLSNYYKSFNQVGSNAEFNTLVSNENYAFDFSSATSYTLRFKDTRYTNVNDFKTWLGTNNVSIIYVLNTPTYTEITNTELIEELEALNTAKSQEGTTNISITSEDLEMILNVSALKGEE